jgi:haloalkane dehalogenase
MRKGLGRLQTRNVWNCRMRSDVKENLIGHAYADWLKTSSVPKLFLKAEPGGILAGGKVLEHARSLPAQSEVTVKGIHFVQKDSPDDEIGRAVARWMKTLG